MTTEPKLPKGWEIKRLGDIAISEKGKKPKNQSNQKTDEFCYPYVDIEAFEKGIVKSYTDGVKCVLCDENDFLMVWDGSRSGLVGKGINGALGSTLVRISLLDVNNLYAYYFLLSKYKEINTRAKGSGTPHVAPDLLWNYTFPIPPSQETQQAIVNKIESLFAEIDAGIDCLKTAAQQLKQYRQSLLKNAFNGELTKAWRAEHAHTLPSENELLTQIQTAREQHHAQQLADWQTAISQWEQGGKTGKKPSKPKAPTQVVRFEESSENRGNNSYIRIPVGFFIGSPKYGTSQKCEYEKYENSTGVIRIPNITENGSINLEDMKYAEFSTEEKADYALEKGDLLLIRSNGSVNIVGSVGLVDKRETNYIYAGYLIRLRPIQSIINSKFLKFAFQSLDVRTQIEFKAKSTSGVNNINAQEVQDLQVNVFSLAEQTQIVAILESKLTACDQLAAELTAQLKQAELLKQAVLKSAFSGSLLDK